MALFPCDQHGGRYRGSQQTAYPALVNRSTSMRERRRLCPDCFRALREWCAVRLLPPDEMDTSRCALGDGCVDEPYAVFVTLYPNGEEREDWYGRLCRAHLTAGALALFGAQAALPDPFRP